MSEAKHQLFLKFKKNEYRGLSLEEEIRELDEGGDCFFGFLN